VTPAERDLIRASCARAAEVWAAGQEVAAERWFLAAIEICGNAEFIDTDEEASR
jgi:hypothetical protein